MKKEWNHVLETYDQVYELVKSGERVQARVWVPIVDSDGIDYEQYFCFRWKEGSIDDVELSTPNFHEEWEVRQALVWFKVNAYKLEWQYYED